MAMAYVPAGPFTMGSSEEQVDYALANCIHDEPGYECLRSWFVNEQPARAVALAEYWIDHTEVTNTAFAAFLTDIGATESQMGDALLIWSSASRVEYRDGGWHVEPPYAEHPMAGVTWFGAQAYCKWAGRRLPTEAEWEKAARGTDGRIFPWGNHDATCLLANYGACVGETTPVGSYPSGASPYGAMDMAGNVWEWVQDRYQEDYYSVAPDTDPLGSLAGWERVLRGGWAMGDPRDTAYIRTTVRYFNSPTSADPAFGFRCASAP
jgi:serine/threonine-protein kinase